MCTRCERWNLAPIESRWEAIEECERVWRVTRTRASGGEIGLARVRDGTTLVRIGKPLPLEFAAWRYGDQFGRRRWKSLALGTGAVLGVGAIAAGSVAAGLTLIGILPVFQTSMILMLHAGVGLGRWNRRLPDPAGGTVTPAGSPKLIVGSHADGGWGLEIFYSERTSPDGNSTDDQWAREGRMAKPAPTIIGSVNIYGAEALRTLAYYAPRLNRGGASTRHVGDAVTVIADAGGPDALPRWLAANRARLAARQVMGDSGDLHFLPTSIKLAIEMASHEELEYALLAGELAALEAQWRAAEEEAAIADQLLLPEKISVKLEALREAVRRDA